MFKIIDNYLDTGEFNKIKHHVESYNSFDWYLSPKANELSDDPRSFQFMHNMIWEGKPNYSEVNEYVKILLRPLNKKLRVHRCKVNLFIKQDEPISMGFHTDYYDDNINTLLIYLEDSNGYTEFDDGDIAESKRNRAIFFRSDKWHQTITSTDTLFRRNININYKIL